MKFIDLDFETRSTVDIMNAGAYVYASDISTEILIMSWSFDGGKTVSNYTPYFSKPSVLKKFLRKINIKLKQGWKIRAFNSMFEYLIWHKVGIDQLGFPHIKLNQMYCVMAEACQMGFPASLANASAVIGGATKNTEGTALISFFSKPSRSKDIEFNSPLDNKDKFFKFIEYCDDDVRAQISVSNACNPMSKSQYEIFLLTERMNIRGLPIDQEMIEGGIALNNFSKDEYKREIQELTDGVVTSPTQNKVLLEWLNSNGCDISNLQVATVERWLAKPNLRSLHKKALELRFNGSKSSTAKYNKALIYLVDGWVHDFIKYHIASTGRWGGRGVQIQNYPKPHKDFPKWADHEELCKIIGERDAPWLSGIYGSIAECLKAAARGMICAPEGYKLICADYAQIEARIVMWLAGDKTGISDFLGDAKIYEKMAGSIYSVDYQTIGKGTLQRDLGKEAILGCGFGMGHKRFYSQCTMVRNIPLEEATAKLAVKTYRSRYAEVPKAWKECSKQAIRAIKSPCTPFEACEGRLIYTFDGTNLFVRLPSGRALCYPHASVEPKVDDWGRVSDVVCYHMWDHKTKFLPNGTKWVKVDTWGGTLFQHTVQAVAADIMGNGMLKGEKEGYKCIFTVHDESVALVKENGRHNFREYEEILCRLPKWAKGLPIAAEGWEGKRYKK